jgi:hypothetical protein
MTAGEFVAWVASRCEAFAAKCRDEGILGVEVRLRLLPRDGVGPFHTARTARGSAVHALRTARIASRGYRGTWERVTGADREDISAGEWSDLKLVDRKLGDAERMGGSDRSQREADTRLHLLARTTIRPLRCVGCVSGECTHSSRNGAAALFRCRQARDRARSCRPGSGISAACGATGDPRRYSRTRTGWRATSWAAR